MAGGITSSLSPGYLQVNPKYIESAYKLRRQYRSSIENLEAAKSVKSEEATEKFDAVQNRKSTIDNDLNEQDKALITELKSKEREVLSHEAAHISAGGGFVGSPKYSRAVGPDGKSYITGGEVSISVPPSSDPKETIRNMEQVRKAALAPFDPSSQDLNVAAAAANAQAQAAAELAAHQAEWGVEPQPARVNFDDTDKVPAELPIIKKYRSSANNEESGVVASSMAPAREGSLSKDKPLTDLNKLTENEPYNYYSKVAPEENLYYTRIARQVYFLSSSPKGLWTISKGYESVSSSPALIVAQTFSIAA
ncbi:MAG: hypothetical protein FWF87_03360 [Synergistaceae bacterium]|nr:hypothetical protein [Synergistaceae bacterium]